MKNLNDLSSVLFETLNEIRSGKMEREKAETIVKVSNSLINNGKLQLSAAKFMNVDHSPEFFGLPEKEEKPFDPTKAIAQKKQEQKAPAKPANPYKEKNLVEAKESFAKEIGFDTLGKAVAKMGNTEFNRQFKQWIEN